MTLNNPGGVRRVHGSDRRSAEDPDRFADFVLADGRPVLRVLAASFSFQLSALSCQLAASRSDRSIHEIRHDEKTISLSDSRGGAGRALRCLCHDRLAGTGAGACGVRRRPMGGRDKWNCHRARDHGDADCGSQVERDDRYPRAGRERHAAWRRDRPGVGGPLYAVRPRRSRVQGHAVARRDDHFRHVHSGRTGHSVQAATEGGSISGSNRCARRVRRVRAIGDEELGSARTRDRDRQGRQGRAGERLRPSKRPGELARDSRHDLRDRLVHQGLHDDGDGDSGRGRQACVG